jgi:O-antigen ligase
MFWFCSIVMALAVLLGGGTRAGFLGDALLQGLSIPLLLGALWGARQAGRQNRRAARVILLIGAITLFVLGTQLVPLPAGWQPERAFLFAGQHYDSASMLSSLSMAPQATWAAAASLLVPAAIFAAVIQFNVRQRMILCWLLTALGALTLALGFLQMAQGPGSALRFYDITNPTEAVGFFANRNHFAAYLYVTLILAAVWFAITAGALMEEGALKSRAIFWFAAAAVFLVAIVAGLAMARSRAGIVLAMAALAGVVLMVLRQRRPGAAVPNKRRPGAARVSIVVVVFAVVFAAQFGLGSILSRFEADTLEDLRIPFNRTTFDAALNLLPFGTGLGSFVPVYATVEKKDDVFSGYANRAHNDFAELFLETGLLGAALLLVFAGWFVRRAYAVWVRPDPSSGSAEVLLERAATLIIGLLLAHSLVDYPLRTAALSAVFVFCCAVLAVPVFTPYRQSIPRRRNGALRRQEALSPQRVWIEDVQWPESWQKKGDGAEEA